MDRYGNVRVDGTVDDDILHDYWSLYHALRRNDPQVTAIDRGNLWLLPIGYGIHLGDALQQNTHVTSLELECDILLPRDCHSIHHVQPLMDYLRTSDVLQKVELTRHTDEDLQSTTAVAGAIVKAIAENSSVETVILDVIPAAQEFQYFMSTTDSVTTLHFNLAEDTVSSFVEPDLSLMAESFGMNRTIESLSFGWRIQPNLVSRILVQLRDRSCGLKELTLSASGECGNQYTLVYASDLKQLLHSTPRLQHLALESFAIEAEEMSELVDGLVCQTSDTSIPSVVISKLSLISCTVNEDATNELVRFMQTRSTGDNGVHSRLRELIIDNDRQWFRTDEDDISARVLVSMLAMQPEHEPSLTHQRHSTVGSQIRSLTVSLREGPFVEFFQQMAVEASQIRLAQLNLDSVDRAECPALVQYLSSSLTLRELTITRWQSRVSPTHLVNSLRENQSLYRVSVTGYVGDSDGEVPIFDASQSRLVQAFCQRNRALPYLLKSPQWLDPPNQRSALGVETSKVAEVYPKFLLIAQGRTPNKRFALRNLSGSLLHVEDAVGHEGNGKRKR